MSTQIRPAGQFNFLAPDGSVPALQGVIDQASGSLTQQLVPVIRNEILPVLQNDVELQMNIGRGAGEEIAKPLWLMVVLFGGYVTWKVLEKRNEP